MLRLVERWRVVLFAVLLASCGDSGNEPPAECVDNVCPCSEGGIRAAIAEGRGAYRFDCEGPRTVSTRSEIVIENDVSLDGEGNLTVDANQRHRVFSVPRDVTVELIGFTVANGRQTEDHGGGIRNEGTLTLTDSTVTESVAGRDRGCRTDDPALLCSEGGGIWSSGTLTLTRTTVSGSLAHFGGGIANRGGSVTLVESSVSASSAAGCRGTGAVVCSGGGGIWNSGTLTMSNSTVTGSTADWGGGIYNRGAPTLTECRISGNTAAFDGGGLLNFETLLVVDSTVADNTAGQSGGGIANQAGRLEVTRSTLSGNTAAAAGGAVYNPTGASVDLLNMTVSGNVADRGGAIYNSGALTLTSSTVAANAASTASAIYDPGTSGETPRSITSTLIEGECGGSPFDSGGHNLATPANTCGFNRDTDRVSTQAQLNLGPLDDNGGPTMTHAPGAGGFGDASDAIDWIPADACLDADGMALTTDQRGEPRLMGEGSACDVGALEVQP